MDSFEWNKIAGWVLAAAIAVLALSILTGFVFHDERPEEMAYIVDVPEEELAEGEEAVPPIAFFLQTAEAARGANVFKKCMACHNVEPGGPNGTGPNLFGVVGRDIGTRAGFQYSGALLSEPGEWTFEKLSEYLESPRKAIPGNAMSFAGLSDPQDRAHLIAYLNEQSPHPIPIPAYTPPPAEVAEAATGPAAVEAETPVPELEDAAEVPEGNIEGPAAPDVETDAEGVREAN